jgi:hypothetical protein
MGGKRPTLDCRTGQAQQKDLPVMSEPGGLDQRIFLLIKSWLAKH